MPKNLNHGIGHLQGESQKYSQEPGLGAMARVWRPKPFKFKSPFPWQTTVDKQGIRNEFRRHDMPTSRSQGTEKARSAFRRGEESSSLRRGKLKRGEAPSHIVCENAKDLLRESVWWTKNRAVCNAGTFRNPEGRLVRSDEI